MPSLPPEVPSTKGRLRNNYKLGARGLEDRLAERQEGREKKGPEPGHPLALRAREVRGGGDREGPDEKCHSGRNELPPRPVPQGGEGAESFAAPLPGQNQKQEEG